MRSRDPGELSGDRRGGRRGRHGSVGPCPEVRSDDVLTTEELSAALGSRATFVQFSTTVCSPCRATRAVLSELTSHLSEVTHVELDAEQHLDLVRRLHVRRTPTVLILNAKGRIVRRMSGAVTAVQAREAIADLVPEAVAA
ncbi:MAG: thioredoxin family protein [Kineosporiaceae bacterium]|nr:thioredoxin family protein [Kineosporiaceae bacterium]